jgi:OOP family OmpA-OmpF porin
MKKIIIIGVTFVSFSGIWGYWQTPENIGGPINTRYADLNPMFPRDGSFMILTSSRPGGRGEWDLWRSNKKNGKWQQPVNLGPDVNSPVREGMAYLTENGTKLYYVSTKPKGQGKEDIWVCDYTGGSARNSKNLGDVVNSPANDFCPTLTRDGRTLFFASDREGGYGSSDIWMTEYNGVTWSTPENLGEYVNASGRDAPQWISDDGRTLLLSSDRTGTTGLYDLWYSVKEGNKWPKPVTLGSVINSPSEDHGAHLYCNHGRLAGVLGFSSNRPGGNGDFDIWISEDTGCTSLMPGSLGKVKTLFY